MQVARNTAELAVARESNNEPLVAALEAERAGAMRRWQHAAGRLKGLVSDLAPRVRRCGTATRWVTCACGPRAVELACSQRVLCERCRIMSARRLKRRLFRAVVFHVEQARRAKRSARVRLLTLTTAHSGDLRQDREEITRGWRALRKAFHRWWGYQPAFALVWEATPGNDARGHVHAHVLVIGGPRWWHYSAIQRVWRAAVPRSTGLHVRAGSSNAKAAAHYLGKYLSKGIDSADDRWTDESTAQLLAATYQARMVATSRRFWAIAEPCACRICGERMRAFIATPWAFAVVRATGREPALNAAPRAGPDDVPRDPVVVFHVEHLTD